MQLPYVETTCRFGRRILEGYRAIVHASSRVFDCDPSAPAGYGGLVLFHGDSWSAQPATDDTPSILHGRILPSNVVLSFVAAAVLAMYAGQQHVMILTIYEHTAQLLKRHLTPAYLSEVIETLAADLQGTWGLDLQGATLREHAVRAHAALDVRTIRSARGATCAAVILLVHRRYARDTGAQGQWYDDPGMRRVAFSRARCSMLVVGDVLCESGGGVYSGKSYVPGLGALGQVWPVFRQSSCTPYTLLRDHTSADCRGADYLQLSFIVQAWSRVGRSLAANMGAVHAPLPCVGPPSQRRASVAAAFREPWTRCASTARLLSELHQRRPRAVPAEEERTSQHVIEGFNSSLLSLGEEHEIATSTSALAWLNRASHYAVPAVHWCISLNSRRQDVSHGLPHLVSIPFFKTHLPWSSSEHPGDEHLQLCKLLCPPDHILTVHRQRSRTVASEHTSHFWKEFDEDVFPVSIRRRGSSSCRPLTRLCAYRDVCSKRMLTCLQNVVLRIADLDMVLHVARQLGTHWHTYELDSTHVATFDADSDNSGASVFRRLQVAWREGRAAHLATPVLPVVPPCEDDGSAALRRAYSGAPRRRSRAPSPVRRATRVRLL